MGQPASGNTSGAPSHKTRYDGPISRSSSSERETRKSLVGAPHLPLALSSRRTALATANDAAPIRTQPRRNNEEARGPSSRIADGPKAAHQQTPTAASTIEPSATITSRRVRSLNQSFCEHHAKRNPTRAREPPVNAIRRRSPRPSRSGTAATNNGLHVAHALP